MADTIQLLQNLTLLVALHAIIGFVDLRRRSAQWFSLVQGVLFGAVMVLGMARAVELQKGVIYDGRSVIASLCGLFFGPAAATVAASMGVAWRLLVAGPGTVAGVLMIVVAAALGSAFHHRCRCEESMTVGCLLAFGYMVQLAMLALLFTLPRPLATEVLRRVVWVVLLAYPATTAFMGHLFSVQQARLSLVRGMHDKLESLQTTFHSMGDGVIATNASGRVEQIDDEAQRLTGWREASALGQPLGLVFRVRSMRTGKDVDEPHERLRRGGPLVAPDDHATLVTRLGQETPITYLATTIRTPDGLFGGLVIVFRREFPEQTVRREAFESVRRYRNLVDSEGVLAWTTGRDGGLDFPNSSWPEFTGRPLAELVGHRWLACVHPEDRARLRETCQVATANCEPFQLVLRLRRHDGAFRRVFASASPLRDADGSLLGYAAHGLDVTDLLHAHKLHEGLFRSVPAGLAVFRTVRDASGMPIDYFLLEANPAFDRILGVHAEDLVSQPVCQAFPDMESDWLELYEQVALTGEAGALEWPAPPAVPRLRITAFRPEPNELALLLVELPGR